MVESHGFRHFGTAGTAQNPALVDEARVLYRSPDGLTLTSYESRTEGIAFTQPAASVWESFYVIEGTITCRGGDGSEAVCRTGDLGYRSWEQESEIRYSDGLRIARFLWAAEPLPQQAGELTMGPLPAALSAVPSTENPGTNSLHVFGDQGPETRYHGQPSTNRPVDVSPDGRHISFQGTLPEGVSFTEYPADVGETFYMIRGNILCRPEGSEETLEWKAGDLVYWPYDRKFDVEYSVGMSCICWFWSDHPLPDFTGGLTGIVGRG